MEPLQLFQAIGEPRETYTSRPFSGRLCRRITSTLYERQLAQTRQAEECRPAPALTREPRSSYSARYLHVRLGLPASADFTPLLPSVIRGLRKILVVFHGRAHHRGAAESRDGLETAQKEVSDHQGAV